LPLATKNHTKVGGTTHTYTISWPDTFAIDANPTYILELSGVASSTRLITIQKIGFTIHTTGTVNFCYPIELRLLSTALTGGTEVGQNPAKFDTANGFNTAITRKKYSVNPTGGGTVIGILRSVMFDALTTAGIPSPQSQCEKVFDFTSKYSEGFKLRTDTERLGLTLLGQAAATTRAYIWVEYLENI